MAEVSPDRNSKGALRIGARLLRGAKMFTTGVKSSVQTSNEVIRRSAKKIRDDQRTINQENKKQRRFEAAVQEEVARRKKSLELGSAAAVGPVKSLVNNVVKKPLESLWNIIAAWAIMNIPRIIKEINIFQKKVRIFVAAIKSAVVTTGKIFGSLLNIGKAFVQNMLEFDFQDKSGRLQAAQSELDTNLEEMNTAFSEMRNVWNREEQDLESMLSSLDSGATLQQAIDYIFGGVDNEFTPISEPQTPMVGEGSGGGSQTGSDNVRALLDTISFAEGTPSYGTIYGGAVVPELAAGELTVAEVLEMQRTGKVRGRDAGYKKDGYNSDATGRYQFMSYTLEEEVEKQGIPMNAKFTPALQDQMILARIARMRGVTEEKVNKEGLSADVIDRLAPEFASFPNLKGPDSRGRTGTNTSYYGQGGKSQSELVDYFDKAQGTNRSTAQQPQPTQPRGGGGSAVIDEANVAANRNPTVGISSKYKSPSRPGHRGIDIGTSGETGWLVGLKLSGQVNEKGYEGGYGNFVGIYVPGLNKTFFFAHLKRSFVKKGQSYNGQAIGEIGNTGRSQGEHLHFEVHQGNTAGRSWGGNDLDPTPYLRYLSIGRKRTRATGSAANIESTAPDRAQETTTTAASRRTNTNKGNDRTFVIRLPILMGSK